MSGKLAPRRTGKMRRQIVHMPYDRVFKVPAMKRGRGGRDGKPQKVWMVIHKRPKDL